MRDPYTAVFTYGATTLCYPPCYYRLHGRGCQHVHARCYHYEDCDWKAKSVRFMCFGEICMPNLQAF